MSAPTPDARDSFRIRLPTAASGGGFDLGLDEGAVILVVVLGAALVVGGGAVYILWSAPWILGDAAVSVLLAAVLAKSSRTSREAGWFPRVARATALPFLLSLLALAAAGYALQSAAPEATRIVDAIAALRS